jgi:3-methyladenine DNA glycosylase AlkC
MLYEIHGHLRIPLAPRSIQKGSSLADLLGATTIDCHAHNLQQVWPAFPAAAFRKTALQGLEPLGLMDRSRHLAKALRQHLPGEFAAAVDLLILALTPRTGETDDIGMKGFFFLPYSDFLAAYGLEAAENGGKDPFPAAMRGQYEVTQRFTAEFSIRPYLLKWQERTLTQLLAWCTDPNPHVRRLCSEGTRPRLPWGIQLKPFILDPTPALPILEALKDDPDLYVRRSVANHLGDLSKDHWPLVLELCRKWLVNASPERQWLIRHAVRYHAKKGLREAQELRLQAGGKVGSKE